MHRTYLNSYIIIYYSYYTDGSSFPLVQIGKDNWIAQTTFYGIFNGEKNIQISKRVPSLQNILRAKLMAIFHTLKLSITTYQTEPIYIFTNSLNSLYLLITQIKHPSLHTNHPDKTIFSEMVDMLCQRTQITSLDKVHAHANIQGNEKADEFAKAQKHLAQPLPFLPHEYAHSIPYYLCKDFWKGKMAKTPYKGPIRHLQGYIKKHTHKYHLEQVVENCPNIKKWTYDPNIDNHLSNNFWNNSKIFEAQIKQLLKFKTGQYMGNVGARVSKEG